MKNNILQNSTIHYVDVIIKTGIKNRASDIHIKYDETGMEIKYRIDGKMTESEKLYKKIEKKILEKNIIEIISRIKILSDMNVAEKRKPQDGSFSFLFNKENYDIRSAFLPTVTGESIVLRILKSFLENTELETLGFSSESKSILEKMLKRSHGMILVSGPTGSGKSTTLMSLINMINDGHKKIITVEDPVENKVKGLIQVQVNNEIGVTFSEVLKSSLRNDPDVIVISEIRDEITAEIAIRAALTGHLVISTVHTIDAVSTIIRLVDMGIPEYLILDSLIGIIGQRLVRRKNTEGRIIINEVLYINEETKSVLKKNKSSVNTKKILKKNSNIEFIDFEQDIKEKIEKNLIEEKNIYNFID